MKPFLRILLWIAIALLGAIAGYFGRAVDEIIMRIADLVFAFPTIILAMVIAAALGPGLKNAIIAILLVSWPSYARVTRSLVMTARGKVGRFPHDSGARQDGRIPISTCM